MMWTQAIANHNAPASRADSLLTTALLRQGIAPRGDSEVEVFTNGSDKFADLQHVIGRARHHIHVEYFIFANDSIANLLLDLLCRKAAEGVEVRLVIDDYKASCRDYGYTAERCAALRAKGVDIRLFDPFRFPYVNHIARDHRKIVVVDGRVGYIGGLNVADYYIVGDPEGYGAWRDTHVRITGPAVEEMQRLFHNAFTASGGEAYDGPDYYPYTTRWQDNDTIDLSYFALPAGLPARRIAFVERSKEKKAEMRRMFIAAFNSAQERLLIVSPYFLPTTGVRRALIAAIDRGVDVQILLSHASDEPLLQVGNLNFAKRLIRHGAKVFLYRGAFHHSKILMVDDSYSLVGSANLNSRSLRWDYEAGCFIFSPEVTARLTDIFEADKCRSDTLTYSSYKALPARQRFLGGIVNHFLTPVL